MAATTVGQSDALVSSGCQSVQSMSQDLASGISALAEEMPNPPEAAKDGSRRSSGSSASDSLGVSSSSVRSAISNSRLATVSPKLSIPLVEPLPGEEEDPPTIDSTNVDFNSFGQLGVGSVEISEQSLSKLADSGERAAKDGREGNGPSEDETCFEALGLEHDELLREIGLVKLDSGMLSGNQELQLGGSGGSGAGVSGGAGGVSASDGGVAGVVGINSRPTQPGPSVPPSSLTIDPQNLRALPRAAGFGAPPSPKADVASGTTHGLPAFNVDVAGGSLQAPTSNPYGSIGGPDTQSWSGAHDAHQYQQFSMHSQEQSSIFREGERLFSAPPHDMHRQVGKPPVPSRFDGSQIGMGTIEQHQSGRSSGHSTPSSGRLSPFEQVQQQHQHQQQHLMQQAHLEARAQAQQYHGLPPTPFAEQNYYNQRSLSLTGGGASGFGDFANYYQHQVNMNVPGHAGNLQGMSKRSNSVPTSFDLYGATQQLGAQQGYGADMGHGGYMPMGMGPSQQIPAANTSAGPYGMQKSNSYGNLVGGDEYGRVGDYGPIGYSNHRRGSLDGGYTDNSVPMMGKAPGMGGMRPGSAGKKRYDSSGDEDDHGGRTKYTLSIERLDQSMDPRTTLMIRNIPNKYSQKMLLSTFDESHKGLYDFFYLPIDFKNKCNVGYAFINFISPQSIKNFFIEFHNKKWEKFNSDKVCELTYGRIQGKINLISHFQNSSLMREDKKYRPIIFHSDGPSKGQEEPFPVGRNVRVRRPSKEESVKGPRSERSGSGSSTGRAPMSNRQRRESR